MATSLMKSSLALHAAPRPRSVRLSATSSRVDSPQVSVVLGTQWGDEGKGKLVDNLAQQFDIVARAQVRGHGTSNDAISAI